MENKDKSAGVYMRFFNEVFFCLYLTFSYSSIFQCKVKGWCEVRNISCYIPGLLLLSPLLQNLPTS